MPALAVLAVVYARAGELPPDAGETVSEANGSVLILGEGAGRAASGADPSPSSPSTGPTTGGGPPSSTHANPAAAHTGPTPPNAGPPATAPASPTPVDAIPASPSSPSTGPSTGGGPPSSTHANPAAAHTGPTPPSADPGATAPVDSASVDAIPAGPGVAVARAVWWCDTGPGLRPGELAARLAPLLTDIRLVILPGTADGRDLAPRLAAELRRPLLARATRAEVTATGVRAGLCRLDGQVVVPAEVDGPAVATLEPGTGILTAGGPPAVTELALPTTPGPTVRPVRDPEVLEVLDADPATAELAEAPVVLAGGAGLAAGLAESPARAAFDLLASVAAALGAVAGATRVATDAGWAGHDRQIGTTGVTIAPRSYVAFGISGATQHVGGIGAPQHLVSVNTDPHCPMTALSGLGIVADARATLAELADRLGVAVPEGLRGQTRQAIGGAGQHPERTRGDPQPANGGAEPRPQRTRGDPQPADGGLRPFPEEVRDADRPV